MANTEPSVKKYVDYANQQVDEQAILDKFNAATIAQYNVQREQNRQAENAFYNQMYNSQQTAVDAIRQANAAAVSTGASRGIQAANELSAILGLQQESVASATELAQANRQTAQEETAAVLENVLNAYQQAEQQRQNIITAGIQAESVEATRAQILADQKAAEEQAKIERDKYLMDLKVNDPNKYYQEVAKDNNATEFENMSAQQYAMNTQNAATAIDEITNPLKYNDNDFAIWDLGVKGKDKPMQYQTSLASLYVAYGLTAEQATEDLKGAAKAVDNYRDSRSAPNWDTKDMKNTAVAYIQAQFTKRYAAKYSTATKQ